ncbi:hypothetical protein LS80_001930 [Helicobacter trogontum]|uniref:Uncharacterized protein n=1 Tax=Helicobacter trogontum TaxID=50960 RepID=A0A4U8TGF5_9HELI|nr:hypothetical protein LS80_001930 [Helicobacter trogontum]
MPLQILAFLLESLLYKVLLIFQKCYQSHIDLWFLIHYLGSFHIPILLFARGFVWIVLPFLR